MLTIQELKNLRINNRNNRVIYNLLSTIIGECEQISKDPSKDQIISIIQNSINQVLIPWCYRKMDEKSYPTSL